MRDLSINWQRASQTHRDAALSFRRSYICGAIGIVFVLFLSMPPLSPLAAARDVYRWCGGRFLHRSWRSASRNRHMQIALAQALS
jgi:hypothetical protein